MFMKVCTGCDFLSLPAMIINFPFLVIIIIILFVLYIYNVFLFLSSILSFQVLLFWREEIYVVIPFALIGGYSHTIVLMGVHLFDYLTFWDLIEMTQGYIRGFAFQIFLFAHFCLRERWFQLILERKVSTESLREKSPQKDCRLLPLLHNFEGRRKSSRHLRLLSSSIFAKHVYCKYFPFYFHPFRGFLFSIFVFFG